ncbi:MAG: DUF4065 domain-containing protein [Candidatus Methanomethylophilaceae archaeon]|nr:DUF4065 domain-containing protein [Candidatus Methanomethylophilaceae archaeon]
MRLTDARVNMFLYFAQGHHLARHGTTLFDDDIESRECGPVVREVYDRFQEYGKAPIQSVHGEYSLDVFTSEELTLLNDIIAKYNRYTTGHLIDIIHGEGGPWDKACSKHTSNIIDNEEIRIWFEDQDLPNFILELVLERGTVGYRDSDGVLVLPKDYE